MEFASFKQQLEAARQAEVQAGGATFKVRLPSEYQRRLAAQRNRDADGRTVEVAAVREVLVAAVIGWQGVTAEHFLPGAGTDSVAFSPEACAELLDCRHDIANEVTVAVAAKLKERRENLEAAAKK